MVMLRGNASLRLDVIVLSGRELTMPQNLRCDADVLRVFIGDGGCHAVPEQMRVYEFAEVRQGVLFECLSLGARAEARAVLRYPQGVVGRRQRIAPALSSGFAQPQQERPVCQQVTIELGHEVVGDRTFEGAVRFGLFLGEGEPVPGVGLKQVPADLDGDEILLPQWAAGKERDHQAVAIILRVLAGHALHGNTVIGLLHQFEAQAEQLTGRHDPGTFVAHRPRAELHLFLQVLQPTPLGRRRQSFGHHDKHSEVIGDGALRAGSSEVVDIIAHPLRRHVLGDAVVDIEPAFFSQEGEPAPVGADGTFAGRGTPRASCSRGLHRIARSLRFFPSL